MNSCSRFQSSTISIIGFGVLYFTSLKAGQTSLTTITAPIVASGTLTEVYSNSGNNITGFSPGGGNPNISTDGTSIVCSAGNGFMDLPIWVDGTGDFAVQFDTYVDAADGDSDICLVNSSGAGIELRNCPAGTDTPNLYIESGTWSTFDYNQITKVATASFSSATWTHVIIEKKGSILTDTVGGQTVSCDLTATPLAATTYIGLGYYATEGASLVKFRNVQVFLPLQIERKVDNDVGVTVPAVYNPITDSNNKLLPGQQVNLKVLVPNGVTPTNIHWFIPNTSFKDYAIAVDGSSASAPTQLLDADLQNAQLTFYWADAGTKMITCTFSIFGQQVTVTASLTVVAPQSSLNRMLGSVIVNGSALTLNNPPNPGIGWTVNVSLPSGFDGTKSKWGLIQLVSMSRQVVVRSDATQAMIDDITNQITKPGTKIVPGGRYKSSFNGVVAGDTQEPYAGAKKNCDGINNSDLGDSPAHGGTGFSNSSVSPNESFQTFLTLYPAGANSRPIPLRVVNWNWGGILNYTPPVWTLTSPSQSASPSPGILWNPTLSFPVWNQLVTRNIQLINN